jgi:hypothetical protein
MKAKFLNTLNDMGLNVENECKVFKYTDMQRLVHYEYAERLTSQR